MFHSNRGRRAGFRTRQGPYRFQPKSEALEERALLSGTTGSVPAPVDSQNVLIVKNMFEHIRHHDPAPRTLDHLVKQLDTHQRSGVDVAAQLLISRAYLHAHPDVPSFVHGLYQDVLGAADPQGEAFWTARIRTHHASLAQVATTLLRSDGSFLRAQNPTGPSGGGSGVNHALRGVMGVSVTPLVNSSYGGNTAQVGLIYNRNGGAFNPPSFTITISVSGAGSYNLDQTQSWGVINNTGARWRTYNLSLLTSRSTAHPSFTSSTDLSGQLPNVALNSTTARFSGGNGVPSGPSPSFAPRTTFTTASAGTIVIVEQPFS